MYVYMCDDAHEPCFPLHRGNRITKLHGYICTPGLRECFIDEALELS